VPVEAAATAAFLQRANALSAAFMRRRGAVLGLSLTALVAIALADLSTGYELSLSALYLGPIVASTWAFGLPAGLALSALSTGAWLATDALAEHHYSLAIYRYWEGGIQLTTFSLFALVVEQLKRALARSDARLIKVLEGLDSAICVIDASPGTILYRNHHFDAAFPAERRGLAVQRLLDVAVMFDSRDHGEELQLDSRWFLVRGRWMNWTDERLVLLLNATDVTARRDAEALSRRQETRLQATARVVAVGEIASSIAHELNQPLAAITSYVQGCLRRLRSGATDPQALAGALEKAGAQAERAGQIIHRVRDFVRSRQPALAALDLNVLIERATAVLAHEPDRAEVRIALDLAPGLPSAQADPLMLEQVVLNLVRNALEAVGDRTGPDQVVEVSTRGGEPGVLEVAIADRGPGIAPESVDRLFEPFHTSKPEGMGLGLNICRSIVEFHGGRLWSVPRPGGGAEFHFTVRTAQSTR